MATGKALRAVAVDVDAGELLSIVVEHGNLPVSVFASLVAEPNSFPSLSFSHDRTALFFEAISCAVRKIVHLLERAVSIRSTKHIPRLAACRQRGVNRIKLTVILCIIDDILGSAVPALVRLSARLGPWATPV